MFSSYTRKAKKLSEKASTYEEWCTLAEEYDQKHGLDGWRDQEESYLYDNDEIKLRLDKLKALKAKGDDHGLLFTLNEGIHGNMGGMGNPKLYTQALSGTKHIIEDYIDATAEAIWHIAQIDHKKIPIEEKMDFFNRASHCFGRTALMLSGGGQLGNFHMGVLKALIDEDLLPKIISGASAGSIFAAIVGTKTNEDLVTFFEPENLMVEVKREKGLLSGLVKKRGAVKINHVVETIERVIPNLTFQEAHDLTGKYINISVAPLESHQKSRLLNATASPNVMIRSAVLASCAIPGIFPPVTLKAKDKNGKEVPYLPSRRWVDGSMSNDLPSKRLSRMFGVNHFIVSLTNPVILPFVRDTSSDNEFIGAIRRFGSNLIKETTQLNYTLAKPFFKYWPKLAIAANNINSVVQQNYLGDINITADFSVIKPNHLLSTLTIEEIAALIKNGERSTWPMIERIRISTKIGRILDHIRSEFGKQELKLNKETIHYN